MNTQTFNVVGWNGNKNDQFAIFEIAPYQLTKHNFLYRSDKPKSNLKNGLLKVC